MKPIYYLLFFTLIFSCHSIIKSPVGGEVKTLEEKPLSRLEQYMQQEHRFKIDVCKLYYNEQYVSLGDIKTFTDIFGVDYVQKTEMWNGKIDTSAQCFYQDKPFTVKMYGGKANLVEQMVIKLSERYTYTYNMENGFPGLVSTFDSLFHTVPALEGYIMIDGQLIDQSMSIEDVNGYRKEHGLPLFTPFLGNMANQGITYGGSYCDPGENFRSDYLTDIGIGFNKSSVFKDPGVVPTNIMQVFYDYTNDKFPGDED